jgi:carbon storage regulator
MLVLSRKIGEKVVVPGCELTLTVLGVQGNRVRLGITAPPEVTVLREEVSRRPERQAVQGEEPRAACGS